MPALKTQYSILLLSVVLIFTILCFAGWRFFTTTLQLRQTETDLTSTMAEWNSLVGATRALYISDVPIHKTYELWVAQRQRFLVQFKNMEKSFRFQVDDDPEILTRFRLIANGLQRGLFMLQNISEICTEFLETIDQYHPGFSNRLSGARIKDELLRKQLNVEYSFVLASQLEQRISYLDSTFGYIFDEDQTQLRGLISHQIQDMAEVSQIGLIILIGCIFVALGIFLWRIWNINRILQEIVTGKTQALQKTIQTLAETQADLAESQLQTSITSMVVGLSHELNTPLGNALMCSTTLKDRVIRFSEFEKAGRLTRNSLTEFVRGQSEMMDLLVCSLEKLRDQIQYYRGLSSDLNGERMISFCPYEFMKPVFDKILRQAESKHIAFELDIPPDLTLTSYPGTISAIIIQLSDNSFVHAFKGRQDGKIWLHMSETAAEVILEYGDNGDGIPPEIRSKIFDPFFTTARSEGYVGLGLNIMYNQVRHQLHGFLELQHEKNCLRFTIRIPKILAGTIQEGIK